MRRAMTSWKHSFLQLYKILNIMESSQECLNLNVQKFRLNAVIIMDYHMDSFFVGFILPLVFCSNAFELQTSKIIQNMIRHTQSTDINMAQRWHSCSNAEMSIINGTITITDSVWYDKLFDQCATLTLEEEQPTKFFSISLINFCSENKCLQIDGTMQPGRQDMSECCFIFRYPIQFSLCCQFNQFSHMINIAFSWTRLS